MTEPKSDTEFEEQFKTELSQGNSVRVSFDGTNQIGDKSFLYRFLKDKSRVANYDEFIEQIHKLDKRKVEKA